MTTDSKILELILNEETKAEGFKLLMEKFQEPIYWNIRRQIKNHDDTNDIMQNVFVKVLLNIPNFRNDSNLYTWIFRISRNETLNFLNSAVNRRTTDLDPVLFEESMVSSSYSIPGHLIEQKLMRAIELLPEKQQVVFNLKYFEEKKYSEMSQLLGTSEGALKASYHHAVKKIKELMKII
jgi:RNA polymerase sigma-70 factor (ECF subfamily)